MSSKFAVRVAGCSAMTPASRPADADFASIDDILAEARAGRPVVMLDAEDRENQGDLIVPAQFATPRIINYMAFHARGLVCLAITCARARQLRLSLQPGVIGADRVRTAFAVSIEARSGVATGISAFDRARTVAVAIDPGSNGNDLVSPGHVFPLVARDGGVLDRDGHTEAAVDIARLAGLTPAAVLCEILNDDGSVGRPPDLLAFARDRRIKIGRIEDLVAYRRLHDLSLSDSGVSYAVANGNRPINLRLRKA